MGAGQEPINTLDNHNFEDFGAAHRKTRSWLVCDDWRGNAQNHFSPFFFRTAAEGTLWITKSVETTL